MLFFFFFQAEDGIRDSSVTGVQTCALPIYTSKRAMPASMLLTNTFAYQKKPMLVAISSSLTELTGRPRCHIHAVCKRKAIVTTPARETAVVRIASIVDA